MKHEDLRRRAVAYALFASLAGPGWWAATRGGPLYSELRSARSHLEGLEATTRQAREQTVRSGGAGIEDSIAAARSRYEAVAELAPGVGEGDSDADLRRLVAVLAERNRVVVRSSEEAPGERAGQLLVSGVRISAQGRYHDIGQWLSSVEATRRLIRLSVATLAASADTAGRVPPSAMGPVDPQASVRFEGTFRWFRRDSAAADQDSLQEAN